MDVFKLLARSTHLQKSAPSTRKPQQQNIPSSAGNTGQTPSAENSKPAQYLSQEPEPRGTKRKRRIDHREVPPSLDLNTSKERPLASALPRPLPELDAYVKSKESEHGHEIDGSLVKAGPLEEDECRRILKRNKIKIMLLQSDRRQGTKGVQENHSQGHATPEKNTRLRLSPQPLTSFAQLRANYGISRRLSENLDAQGFIHPTEVQLGTLPLLLGSDEDRGLPISNSNSKKRKRHIQSHVDLLTVAPTGSGKTLAFMIHVLHGILQERRKHRKLGLDKVDHEIQALVIAPTHELADQIVNEGRRLAVGLGIRVSAMRKDMKIYADARSADRGAIRDLADKIHEASGERRPRPIIKADILVSTPMILLNALKFDAESPPALLPTVRYLILDEADVLLDPLFRAQTLEIWDACRNLELQTSFWSATIGSSIESLSRSTILERRRDLNLDSSPHYFIRAVVGLKDSAIPNILHRLTYAATEHGKLLALRQLLHPTAPSQDKGPSLRPPFLIFTQTIQRAIALHSELLYDIPPEAGGSSRIAVLHSDLSDNARSAIMAGFRKGEIWVLITTDLLSRGMDFRGMNGVVNYDIPNTSASYVHRVGRTGRQGRVGGVAVTLYTKEDIPFVKNIANVVAASEKATGVPEGSEQADMQKWLLDALPTVSKKTRSELKRKGVASRRTYKGKEGGKEARRARISTKSGYDRRLENRRKAALAGKPGQSGREKLDTREASDGEWGGLDD